MAVPAAELPAQARGAGRHPEHIAQGHLPGQRLHGGVLRAHEGRVLPRPQVRLIR